MFTRAPYAMRSSWFCTAACVVFASVQIVACSSDEVPETQASDTHDETNTDGTASSTTRGSSATPLGMTSIAASPSSVGDTATHANSTDNATTLAATTEPVDDSTGTTSDESITSHPMTTASGDEADAGARPVNTFDASASHADAATVAVASSNICDEIVPEDRYVDGIPAYSQCAESESVGVWSSDGVTTALEQQSDWRRTQWGGGYQCTEFANRYLFFVWGVDSVPNGDAGTWCDEEPPEGLIQAQLPVHGDLIVFAPGSCGASAETGHVAVVDEVTLDRVVIVEQNRAGRRSTDISCAACFLHAVANDGS